VASPIVGDPDVDAQAALDALSRAGVHADGVLTYWEDSTCVAARVAVALGLPGNPPEAVDAARSKVRTRELSAELGLPTPKARRVRSLDELFDAAAEVGFPAVVKPEFGAAAMGCVRVDDLTDLPGVYALVRDVVRPETDSIFRAGNDLLLEEYLDGVEFDVDLVMHEGECVFSSVSQNWPTAEPSFQETGLHIPPDHDSGEVRHLVELTIRAAQAFGLHRGVLHIEGKCTTRGPRIVEVNARMGGGRVWEMVQAMWNVDLVEAHARAFLGLPPALEPARRPQCGIVDTIVHASRSGRLVDLPIEEVPDALLIGLDVESRIGDDVNGPEHVFASVLAELVVRDKDLKRARLLAARLLKDPPVIEPHTAAPSYAPTP
jgi:carnosine synthase